MDEPKAKDTIAAVPYNMKAPPLEGEHSTKIGAMRTVKHEIRSSKFYEIINKTALKVDTALGLNKFCK